MTSQSGSRRSATKPSTKPTTTKTTRSGPVDRNFEQAMVDNRFFPQSYSYPDGRNQPKPANLDNIIERLKQPRPSLSPSRFGKEEFDRFVKADANAKKEGQVRDSVIPIIAGRDVNGRTISGDIPFGNLQSLIEGENLKDPKPDIYHGARPEQLLPEIRKELSSYIVPSSQLDLPLAPNFFVVAKGPDGSTAVAKRQACYDGAIGARGIHQLQSYKQEGSVYDNNAYTISSTYHDGTFQIFTHHPGLSDEGQPEYYMNKVVGYHMTGTVNQFRRGVAAYRNAVDFAAEQRNQLLAKANTALEARQSVATACFEPDFSAGIARSDDVEPETSDLNDALRAKTRGKRSGKPTQ